MTFAFLFFVLFLTGCGSEGAPDDAAAGAAVADSAAVAEEATGTPPADTASTETATPADSARVAVEEFKYSRLPDGTRVFSGTLINRTDERIPFAQVQVSLLDENNQRISTASIEVRNIPAGGNKPFQQPLDSDEPFQAARVRSVLMP